MSPLSSGQSSPCPGFRLARFFLIALTGLLFWPGPELQAAPPVATLAATATDRDIQQALHRLPATGGEVVLAPGQYLIHHPLRLERDGQTLRGSGTNTILRLADNANCPVVILGLTEIRPGKSVSHLRLADLVIDGNRARQQVEGWADAANTSNIQNDGVIVQSVTDSVVEHIVCAHCRSGGLVTANEVRRLTVRDFAAYDNEFDGLACYRTEACIFTGLNLHDNRAAGISLDLGFNNNVISNAVLTANDLGLFMRESSTNLFTTLQIRHSRHDGIFMAQAGVSTSTGWQYTPHTQCTDNQFTRLHISDSGGVAFRVNDASCVGNRITGGEFRRNAGGGLATARTNLVTAEGLAQPAL